MPRLPAGQTTICTTGSLSLLFFSLSLLHNKSDTHKDEAVKNKCSNWANQFRCSQVIKCCSQGKVTAGALPRRQIYHTSLFPTLCWKRKDKKKTCNCLLFITSNVKSSWGLIRHHPVAQICKQGVISFVTARMNNLLTHYSFQIFCLATSGSNTRYSSFYILRYRPEIREFIFFLQEPQQQ